MKIIVTTFTFVFWALGSAALADTSNLSGAGSLGITIIALGPVAPIVAGDTALQTSVALDLAPTSSVGRQGKMRTWIIRPATEPAQKSTGR